MSAEDELKALDASKEPLCVICQASFRDPGKFLCAACRGEPA